MESSFVRSGLELGKVMIGYPVGGSVTLGFHASILQVNRHEILKAYMALVAGLDAAEAGLLSYANRGRVIQPAESYALLRKIQEAITTSPAKILGNTEHTQGLYVADNRTMLVQRFLESSCEWLLQIDTDIVFEPTLLEELLRLAGSDKKILAASVPLGEKFRSCAFMRDEKKVGGWRDLWPVPLEPIRCDAVATACCLVHREVFETIADHHGQCWFHHIYLPDSPTGTPPRDFKFLSQGEDIAFSVRAARTGFKLWAVHVPGLRHHKTRSLSHDDDRARMYAGLDSGVGEIVDEGVGA